MSGPQAKSRSDQEMPADAESVTSRLRAVPTEVRLRHHETDNGRQRKKPTSLKNRPESGAAADHPNAHDLLLEEIFEIVDRRFTGKPTVDPEFCRFVGLLPEIEGAKSRYGLVREARMVAGYFDRDDVDPETAERIVDGLATKMRSSATVPALHVLEGLGLFIVLLLLEIIALSVWWHMLDWRPDDPGGGFYIFNVSPWLIIAVGAAGGLGSVVSMLTRLQYFNTWTRTDYRLLRLIGLTRPLIGVSLGLLLLALLISRLFPFDFPNDFRANFVYVALAFIGGFSERLSLEIVGAVEQRIFGHEPKNDSSAVTIERRGLGQKSEGGNAAAAPRPGPAGAGPSPR